MTKTATPGADLLHGYMANHSLSCAAIAAKLGCSKQHIGFIKNGDKTPGLDLAVKIEALTGIPVASWTKSTEKSEP